MKLIIPCLLCAIVPLPSGAQESAPSATDQVRGVWNTALQDQRKAVASGNPRPAGPTLIGVTLWRMLPHQLGDQRYRALVHTKDGDIPMALERVSLTESFRDG